MPGQPRAQEDPDRPCDRLRDADQQERPRKSDGDKRPDRDRIMRERDTVAGRKAQERLLNVLHELLAEGLVYSKYLHELLTLCWKQLGVGYDGDSVAWFKPRKNEIYHVDNEEHDDGRDYSLAKV